MLLPRLVSRLENFIVNGSVAPTNVEQPRCPTRCRKDLRCIGGIAAERKRNLALAKEHGHDLDSGVVNGFHAL